MLAKTTTRSSGSIIPSCSSSSEEHVGVWEAANVWEAAYNDLVMIAIKSCMIFFPSSDCTKLDSILKLHNRKARFVISHTAWFTLVCLTPYFLVIMYRLLTHTRPRKSYLIYVLNTWKLPIIVFVCRGMYVPCSWVSEMPHIYLFKGKEIVLSFLLLSSLYLSDKKLFFICI